MSKNFILIEIEQMPMSAPDNNGLKVALAHMMFAFGATATVENLSEDELEERFGGKDETAEDLGDDWAGEDDDDEDDAADDTSFQLPG